MKRLLLLPVVVLLSLLLPGCWESGRMIDADEADSQEEDLDQDGGVQPDGEELDEWEDDFYDEREWDIPPDEPEWDIPPDEREWDIPPDEREWDISDDGGPVLCVREGCVVEHLWTGSCCAGLIEASECDPASGDPACMMRYCINCGDGVCDPHENRYNCSADCCAAPCSRGAAEASRCGAGDLHDCICEAPSCVPQCLINWDRTGWYDLCTGRLIRVDRDCLSETPVCRNICSRSEGWYESGSGELISWGICSNEWSCIVTWW